MIEKSVGKDTTTGHWEMMGIITERPFPVYPHGFPKEIINEIERVTGFQVLGSKPASEPPLLRIRRRTYRTGFPIYILRPIVCLQIAAHEEIISIKDLYRLCEMVREL